MSFEMLLKRDIVKEGFGESGYIHTFKKRPHISRADIDSYKSGVYLNIKDSRTIRYAPDSERYIGCLSMTYDLLFSMYDVDTSAIFAIRFYYMDRVVREAERFIREFGSRNIEARIFGMQDRQRIPNISGIVNWISKRGIPVYEVDLFGSQVRHIAIDAKSGTTFNILVENRLYKAGELNNSVNISDFKQAVNTGSDVSKIWRASP